MALHLFFAPRFAVIVHPGSARWYSHQFAWPFLLVDITYNTYKLQTLTLNRNSGRCKIEFKFFRGTFCSPFFLRRFDVQKNVASCCECNNCKTCVNSFSFQCCTIVALFPMIDIDVWWKTSFHNFPFFLLFMSLLMLLVLLLAWTNNNWETFSCRSVCKYHAVERRKE